MVKGILKRYSRFANPRPALPAEDGHHSVHDDSPKQKRVSFDGAEPTKVFEADEWDRSPAAVTLKLTYKDVAELKELNVSLVSPSPLAMSRTVSRRPTKKRTPVDTSVPAQMDSNASNSSPYPVSESQGSPGYQYHTFTSQSLPPLLEDVSSASPPPSPMGLPVGYLPSDHPPGLSAVRTPTLRGLGSPVLSPPSPLLLSPPLLRPSSPKPASSHLHINSRPRSNKGATFVHPGTTEAPVPVMLPILTQQQPSSLVAQELKLEKLMLDSEDDEDNKDSLSLKWHGLTEMYLDHVDPAKEDADELERPLTPVVTRKPAKSLMGWEFKRNALGFGLVRAKPRTEETF